MRNFESQFKQFKQYWKDEVSLAYVDNSLYLTWDSGTKEPIFQKLEEDMQL